MSMHRVHCMRNTRRCVHCSTPLLQRDYDAHVRSKRGTAQDFARAVLQADGARVGEMLQHAFPLQAPLEDADPGAVAVPGAAGALSAVLFEGADLPLHCAIRARSRGIAELLLQRGANVNSPNKAGETPLHVACGLPNPSLHAALASERQERKAADPSGSPPLGLPLGRSRSFSNARDAEGAASLAAEAASGSSGALQRGLSLPSGLGGLVQQQQRPPLPGTAPLSFSGAALSFAASTEAGAAAAGSAHSDPDADTAQSETPAVPSISPAELVSFLLRSGGDADARTLLGDTPLQIAQRARNAEVSLMLTAATGASLRPASASSAKPAAGSLGGTAAGIGMLGALRRPSLTSLTALPLGAPTALSTTTAVP
jgi:hypothetical protein